MSVIDQKMLADPRCIEYAVDRICAGVKKHALKREMEEMFEAQLQMGDYERFLRMVERAMIKMTGISRDIQVKRLNGFLWSILANDYTDVRDKINAARQLSKMLGADKGSHDNDAQDTAKEVREFIDGTNSSKTVSEAE